jgi:hypothetical protein
MIFSVKFLVEKAGPNPAAEAAPTTHWRAIAGFGKTFKYGGWGWVSIDEEEAERLRDEVVFPTESGHFITERGCAADVTIVDVGETDANAREAEET